MAWSTKQEQIDPKLDIYRQSVAVILQNYTSLAPPITVPVQNAGLRSTLGPLTNTVDKDDVINFAIYSLLKAQANGYNNTINTCLNSISDLMNPDVTHSELKCAINLTHRFTTFSMTMRETADALASAKDPPAWWVQVIDKTIVGVVKSLPAIGQAAGAAGGLWTSVWGKVVPTLLSNLVAEQAVMTFQAGVTEGKGMTAFAYEYFKERHEQGIDKRFNAVAAQEGFQKINILVMPAPADQAQLAMNAFVNPGSQLLGSFKQKFEEVKIKIGSKHQAGARRSKSAKDLFYIVSDVFQVFGELLEVLGKLAISTSFDTLLTRLDNRLIQLNIDKGTIFPGAGDKQSRAIAAIIYGYFLKRSYVSTNKAIEPEFQHIFRKNTFLQTVEPHNFMQSMLGLRPTLKSTDAGLTNQKMDGGQIMKDYSTGKYQGLHAYDDTSLKNNNPLYKWKHTVEKSKDINSEGYSSHVAGAAKDYIKAINKVFVDTLLTAFGSGIEEKDFKELITLYVCCHTIMNEATRRAGAGNNIFIEDNVINALAKYNWVKTYTKGLGIMWSNKDKITGLVEGGKAELWALRYPTGGRNNPLSGNASVNEVAMLLTFSGSVIRRIDLTRVLMGYDKWVDVKNDLRNIIKNLNETRKSRSAELD